MPQILSQVLPVSVCVEKIKGVKTVLLFCRSQEIGYNYSWGIKCSFTGLGCVPLELYPLVQGMEISNYPFTHLAQFS